MKRTSMPSVAEDMATRQLAQCEFEVPLVVEAGAGDVSDRGDGRVRGTDVSGAGGDDGGRIVGFE